MPYFSYLSMLHVLETLGWWTGSAEVRRVHFAEVRLLSELRTKDSWGWFKGGGERRGDGECRVWACVVLREVADETAGTAPNERECTE